MNKNIQRGLALVGVLFASGSAIAQTAPAGPALSALTGAIGFGTVTAAVLAVAALLAVVYVATKGAKMALAFLKGG